MADAERRATMPGGTHSVLDRRTVAHDNSNLLALVKKGHEVLDVGCGSGAITSGIATLAGNRGKVIGIDTSDHLIETARKNFSGIGNLSFEIADINTYEGKTKFDVVTSARVLQWLSNPGEVVDKMKALLKPGGCVTILDYNHEKVEFSPALPSGMKKLYDAFLLWRKDAGMDNAIADNLEEIFEAAGLINILVADHSEISTAATSTFTDEIMIWKKVAEVRGPQLVKDNYITEDDRQVAIREYGTWMERDAKYMRLYLKAVVGWKR